MIAQATITAASSASSVSIPETQAPSIACGYKNSCQRNWHDWSRVHDVVGLTNQIRALKTRSGIQKSGWAVRLPFQSTFNSAGRCNLETTYIHVALFPGSPIFFSHILKRSGSLGTRLYRNHPFQLYYHVLA